MIRLFLLQMVALVSILTMPAYAVQGRTDSPEEEASASDSPQSEQIAAMEEEVRSRINDLRLEQGLESLEPNPALAKIAREHSRSMSRKEFFSHRAPSGGQVDDRLREAGIDFRMVGENISMSVNVPDPVQTAVQGWMQSKGHRENILKEGFTETGVGIWKDGASYYFTQVFFRPR